MYAGKHDHCYRQFQGRRRQIDARRPPRRLAARAGPPRHAGRCDTQHSSSEWVREAMPGVKAVRLANPDVILNELPLLGQDTDFVVADGPGSNTETSRALLLRADLAIVPCKASMLEVRALAKATEVLRVSQDIRGGLPRAVIVLNMIGMKYRLNADLK